MARPPIPDPPRAASFNASETPVRDDCSAGARPKATPVASVSSAANANTVASRPTSLTRGAFDGASETSPPTAQTPNTSPTAPPRPARSTLSVSSCRTTRARVAPSATRTASSRPRAEPRASSRFAMFAHAIRSTKPTAPNTAINPGLMSPTTRS